MESSINILPFHHSLSYCSTVCVFITEVPITKLFAWGEGDSGACATRDDEPRP